MCTHTNSHKHIKVPNMAGIQVVAFHHSINHWRNLLVQKDTHAAMVQEMVDKVALAAQHNTLWLCLQGAHRSSFGLLTALVAAGHT